MLIFPDVLSVFECKKCRFRTSGIILPGGAKDHRWCPDCNSPMVHCNHCMKFISGTITGAVRCCHCSKFPLTASDGTCEVICDSCKKIVKPEALIVLF